jgi:kynurenine formamidase
MPVYPGDIPVVVCKRRSLEEHGFVAYELNSSLHAGTHLDMPMHFIDDSKYVSDFPLEGFAGKGILLDVRGEECIQMKPEYHELVQENSIVLFLTGHSQYFHSDPARYYKKHPQITEELARFLVSKKIKMLGMDLPGPDYHPFNIHKILLPKGIFMLENLTNLEQLQDVKDFKVMAMPLKIAAEASPVRAIALIHNHGGKAK